MNHFNIYFLIVISFLLSNLRLLANPIVLSSKSTLTVIELDAGDKVSYIKSNGDTLHFEFLSSQHNIVFSTLKDTKQGANKNGSIFNMISRVKVDGQEMEMLRYVPVQQSFYEPYTVNGVQIWFDGLRSLGENFNENHGDCLPQKQARFAFQDLGKSVSPQTLTNWCPVPDRRLKVADAYQGDDVWMGPYFGADLHGGLDINMPSNTPLWAPIDFDTHYYFNSLGAGHNNNRWRGSRTWENGDIWQLQTHHMVELLIPEHQPIAQGETYAHTGGVYTGVTPHTHFVWRIKQPDQEWTFMDPWVFFWEIFNNNREKAGEILAKIDPLSKASTGETIHFKSRGSRPGLWGGVLTYHWDFGDGSIGIHPNPSHTYTRPGIYPVTLTVSDGQDKHAFKQFITVSGETINLPSLYISAEEEPGFDAPAPWKTNTQDSEFPTTNTLRFRGHHDRKEHLLPKTISLFPEHYLWGPDEGRKCRFEALYVHGSDWLELTPSVKEDHILLEILPKTEKMIKKHGFYEAYVLVYHEAFVNSPQYIKVRVDFPWQKPAKGRMVHHDDPFTQRSDYFWLSPEFPFDWTKGQKGHYLINGRKGEGEFIRYNPYLEKGNYSVNLESPAYKYPELAQLVGAFDVWVRHMDGKEKITVNARESLELGRFSMDEHSYVEVVSDGADSLILIDAVNFEWVE
ncbi:PKD domain-containing protein [Pleomorphovibrio marinus]|uniref:PKD domain-containing protein n=1 Tax=Pleomorphovibrio marinus TaxID=2164132 RepID=UPI000E0A07D1|nr:PKD domain-containing protein [Pleomorphovibrio marinus]